jgi:hypothetical protein
MLPFESRCEPKVVVVSVRVNQTLNVLTSRVDVKSDGGGFADPSTIFAATVDDAVEV